MTKISAIAITCIAILASLSCLGTASAQVRDYRHDEYAQAHITWALYHETGHAIQDFTAQRDEMTAQQREDHADKIAAYLMLPKRGEAHEFQLFHDAAIDLYMDTAAPDPNHVYAPSRVRAERMLCMLYGAYPDHPWTGEAQALKNRSDNACIAEFQAFQEQAVDILGFAREFTAIDEPKFIDPRLQNVEDRHRDAYDYLDTTQILLDLAIDVEEWLPALQVADKPFQIVAQECPGYDGFRYAWNESAVVACYAAVQRCMKRPGYLIAEVNAPETVDDAGWLEDGQGYGVVEEAGFDLDEDDGTGFADEDGFDDLDDFEFED